VAQAAAVNFQKVSSQGSKMPQALGY
jgi:hypothetical protein